MSTFRFYCSKKSNKNESICFLVLWSPSFLCHIGEYFKSIKATMPPPPSSKDSAFWQQIFTLKHKFVQIINLFQKITFGRIVTSVTLLVW